MWCQHACVCAALTTFSLSLLVTYRTLGIIQEPPAFVCGLYGEVVLCTDATRAGGGIVAKGTPLLLGAGRRALLTLGGAYKTAQIWWSRCFLLHSQAWTGNPFWKPIASRQ